MNPIEEQLQSHMIVNQLQRLKEYDEDTFWHSMRTAKIAVHICNQMHITETETIVIASLLHDIGKIYIPIEILNKPTKLTTEEFELIKTHPYKGMQHLANAGFNTTIQRIVNEHHENFDGTGYPNKKNHKQLHHLSGILRIADSLDAMQSKRIYKTPMALDEIYEEFQNDHCHCYNPQIITMLCKKG